MTVVYIDSLFLLNLMLDYLLLRVSAPNLRTVCPNAAVGRGSPVWSGLCRVCLSAGR